MKVVLIIPPHPYLADPKRNCPLGILYIASVLEGLGHIVAISDLRDISVPEALDNIPLHGDFYGFTCSTPDYNACKKIALFIKSKCKTVIGIGGAHPTVLPDTIDDVFDKIFIGEGELSIELAMEDIRNNKERKIYQSDFIEDLDTVPFPSRHLLSFESVFNNKLNSTIDGETTTTIITSRGCPFDCSFCTSGAMWHRKLRHRSVDNVIEEIKFLMDEYNIRSFKFQDDTIGINRVRLEELCHRIAPLNISWRSQLRVASYDNDILTLMKDAGCMEICFGIETVDQEVLHINNKRMNIHNAEDLLLRINEIGIQTRLFFIIGLPGEKLGVADRTIGFINRVKPTAVSLSTLVPFPGNDIYLNQNKYGIRLKDVSLDDYVMSLGYGEDEIDKGFIFEHDQMSKDELVRERKAMIDYMETYNLCANK